MKIVAVNRNFFMTGGPEKYMYTLMESAPHHTFIPFCLAFSQNLETPYSGYFVAPPAGPGKVYFHEFRLSGLRKAAFALDSVYNLNARRKLERLIKDERPDLALFLNSVYFSDSIIDACRAHDVPIVWRLSDFNRLCANYLLFRDGKVCEECLEHGLTRAVRNRCGGYQRSTIAALVRTAGIWLSRVRRLHDHVGFFVTPSDFTRRKMIQVGFDPRKVVHVPTMVRVGEDAPELPQDPPEVLFVGRISHEKGVATLLEAFGLIRDGRARLSIVGDDTTPYARRLKAQLPSSVRDRVTFHGYRTQEEIRLHFERAYCFVTPSIWYENQPNSVLEGMSYARPAVVSDLGSMKEIVTDGKTGFLFEAGQARELAERLDELLSDRAEAREMGLRARQYVLDNHSVKKHIGSMDELFRRCTERGR